MNPGTVSNAASPNGAVIRTVLITDLVESTHLVDEMGDARAYEVAAQHDRLARDLMARHGGKEIDKTDGFLVLFERPVDAVRFAVDYHRSLGRMSREQGVELEARVGIHLGEVFLRENSPEDVARGAKPLEVEGLAKPTAARVMSLARGGQTLMTQGALELARRALVGDADYGENLRWLAHGAFAFKGVAEPLQIFEAGLESSAPLTRPEDSEKAWRVAHERSLRGLWRRRPWVVAAVMALLLLSLVTAAYLSQRLWSTAAARPAVAVLGFKNLSGREDAEWLSTALAEMLATELAAGEDLRLIPGENVARTVRELSLPQGETLGRETLARIRSNLGTDFVVVGSFLSLQERLEPLVVQLQDTRQGETVATVRKTGVEGDLYELVARAGADLRRRLGVEGVSTAQAQAVRATLSASPEATRLYSEGLADLRSFDVLAARDHLSEAVKEDPEYALAHAALSQAWTLLGYDNRAEESARRAYELAEGLPREEYLSIQGRYYETAGEWPEAVKTYEVLWGYHPDNIDHGLRLAQAQTKAGQAAEALTTVAALRRLPGPARQDPRIDIAEAQVYWFLSDYPRQLEALERAVEKGRQQGSWILVAEARLRQGWGRTRLGRYEEAVDALDEARRLFSDAGDRGQAARTLVSQGIIFKYQGKLRGAEELFRESLTQHREIGNREAVAIILNNLALVRRDRGALADAREMLQEALTVSQEIGNRSVEALSLEDTALVLLEQGDLPTARQMGRRALGIYEERGERSGAAWTSWDLGQIELAAGDLAAASASLHGALAIAEETGYEHLRGQVLTTLGQLETSQGQLAVASDHFAQALALRRNLEEKGTLPETQAAWARLLLAQGRPQEAEQLAREAVEQLRAQERPDDALVATTTLVEALLVQGEVDAAAELAAAAAEATDASESPLVRLRVLITAARVEAAAGDPQGALNRLDAILAEASRRGLAATALSARLAHCEVELAGQRTAGARSRLDGLADEAGAMGFELIARRARELAQ